MRRNLVAQAARLGRPARALELGIEQAQLRLHQLKLALLFKDQAIELLTVSSVRLNLISSSVKRSSIGFSIVGPSRRRCMRAAYAMDSPEAPWRTIIGQASKQG